jgi:hypothetical protein
VNAAPERANQALLGAVIPKSTFSAACAAFSANYGKENLVTVVLPFVA